MRISSASSRENVWLRLALAPAFWKYFYRQKQLKAAFLAQATPQQLKKVLEVELEVGKEIKHQLNKDISSYLKELKKREIIFISRQHPLFPRQLYNLSQIPVGLFVKGNLGLLKKPVVAIVGSRKATVYGRQIAFEFSQALAEAGSAVISGLAVGIDTQAHLGSLKSGTIAVLGSGLNQIYPPVNRSLATEILKNKGLLLTEYPLDWPVKAVHFPARNRLIAALAQVVIIVEAAEKSGALITADFALELGREVMAVPGSIKNPYASGCHSLIKQGAHPLTDIDDVFSLLQLSYQTKETKPLNAEEQLYLDLIDFQGTPIDQLIVKTKKAPEEALALLSTLELKGYVRKEGGKVLRVK